MELIVTGGVSAIGGGAAVLAWVKALGMSEARLAAAIEGLTTELTEVKQFLKTLAEQQQDHAQRLAVVEDRQRRERDS